MQITVKFFAILRDKTRISQTTLDIFSTSTVQDAARELAVKFPSIQPLLTKLAYAVNEQYVPIDTQLHDGDELALIPPVSGGTSDDWLDLLTLPLNASQATEFVMLPAAGGIDLFLGTTRAEISPIDEPLVALDYQAYESMARKQLSDLANRAREQWPILRLVILHRLGRVPIGEASVLIAVSTPHRAEAFDACRWIIDQLKKEVTIWKQEVWEGGSRRWVNPWQLSPKSETRNPNE